MREQRFPMHYAVTATTRPIRSNEIPGHDYLFVTVDEFERIRTSDGFLEYAEVYGKWYGTPKDQVLPGLEEGQDVLLNVDVEGADTVKPKMPQAVSIFLAPSSFDELKERLTDRMAERNAVEQRLREAESEMTRAGEFDYIVYNRRGELDEAVRQIQEIIA